MPRRSRDALLSNRPIRLSASCHSLVAHATRDQCSMASAPEAKHLASAREASSLNADPHFPMAVYARNYRA